MRLANRSALFSISFSLPLLAVIACSSGVDPAPAKPIYNAPDAYVPPPAPPPSPGPVVILVKGNGQVTSDDGTIDCTPDAGADACTTKHYGMTLNAAGILPWGFDHWEPSLSTDQSLYVASWSASPITAVFTPLPLTDAGSGKD